jgi:hypothetical protein
LAFSAASFRRCNAQEGVAIGRFHFKHAVADFQHGHVEGAAAKVVHGDGAAGLLVEAVSQRRGGGFVDDAQHFQAGDLAGVLGGLALGVVEIGRNGDDGLGDLFTQMRLGRFLHLLQDEAGDFRGRIFLAFAARDPGVAIVGLDDLVGHHADVLLGHRIVEAAPDQALDGEEGVFGIGNRLALGGLADQALAIRRESHNGRGGAGAFRILDDLGG